MKAITGELAWPENSLLILENTTLWAFSSGRKVVFHRYSSEHDLAEAVKAWAALSNGIIEEFIPAKNS